MPRDDQSANSILASHWCHRGSASTPHWVDPKNAQECPATPHVHLRSAVHHDEICELMATPLGDQFLQVAEDHVLGGHVGPSWTSTKTVGDYIRDFRRHFRDAPPVTEGQFLDWSNLSPAIFGQLRRQLVVMLEMFAPDTSGLEQALLEGKQTVLNHKGAEALSPNEAAAVLNTARTHVKSLIKAQKDLMVEWQMFDENEVHLKWSKPSGAEIIAAAAAHDVDLEDLDTCRPFDLRNTDLGAVFILLSLAENSGINLAPAMSLRPDSDKKGHIQVVKLRSRSMVNIDAVDSLSLNRTGGVFNTLRALQRVSCEVRRRDHRVSDEDGKAELLFVNRAVNVGTSQEANPDGWKLMSADAIREFAEGVNASRLRKTAVHLRARQGDFDGAVGQTPRTAKRYLADGLSDDVRHQHAMNGQAEVHILADALVKGMTVDDGPISDDSVDLGPLTCGNGGVDPDNSAQTCNRGVLACFSCPSARLHKHNLPALEALSVVAHKRATDTEDGALFAAVAAAADAGVNRFRTKADDAQIHAAIPLAAAFLNEVRAQ